MKNGLDIARNLRLVLYSPPCCLSRSLVRCRSYSTCFEVTVLSVRSIRICFVVSHMSISTFENAIVSESLGTPVLYRS
jgi:hypothetical protein